VRDGQRILDMALEPPADAAQLQRALVRFADERAGLEAVLAQAGPAAAGGWAGDAGAADRSVASAASAGSAGSTGGRWAWREGGSRVSRAAGDAGGAGAGGGSASQSASQSPARGAAGAGEEDGWGRRRAAVQAQVDEIQQRLGLFVSGGGGGGGE